MSTTFRTFVNAREEGPDLSAETSHLYPSETQPDEVLSIRQMLERHVRGLPVDGEKQDPVYYPEEMGYIPDLKELDLVEIQEYRDYYENKAQEAQKVIEENEEKEKQKSDEIAKQKQADKDLLDSLRNNPKPGEAGKPQKSEGPSK